MTAPSLAAFTQLDRHLAAVGYDLSGGTASERMDAMAARDERDDDLRAAAPYGGTGSGGGGAGKTALDSEPKPRMHIKTTVKLLQIWLNSPEVNGPLVYSTAPVAAAFGVAAVAGVPDEAQSGVGALITYYHDLGDSFEVLRVALARRSVPLTQAVVYDVSTSHPIFDAISSARGDLTAYVSSKLASLDDGTLEMESDELWRAKRRLRRQAHRGQVEQDQLARRRAARDRDRALQVRRACVGQERRPAVVLQPRRRSSSRTPTARCRSWASTATTSSTRRSPACCESTNTTPASSAAKAQLKEHAVRQVAELMNAASTRYRAFIGASSCVPFPAFTNAADKATAMQTQAKATRHLVSSIGACMPSMLHGAAAADDDDDDDDDDAAAVASSARRRQEEGRPSAHRRPAGQPRRQEAQGDGGGSGGGGGGGSKSGGGGSVGVPGDLATRVDTHGDLAAFHWPKIAGPKGREATRKFDVGGVKKELLAAGVKDVSAASSASRSSSCTRCRRPSPTTTGGWRTPTASAATRATRTTTPSQPARTSNCLGSTATC